jgi:hypothetical protein
VSQERERYEDVNGHKMDCNCSRRVTAIIETAA